MPLSPPSFPFQHHPPPSNTYPFCTQNLPACLCGTDLPTTYVYIFTGFRFSLLSQYLNHVRLLKIRRHINFISLNLVAHLFKFSPINFFIWYLYFMTQFSWYYLTQACSNRLDRIRLTLHSAPCSYFLTLLLYFRAIIFVCLSSQPSLKGSVQWTPKGSGVCVELKGWALDQLPQAQIQPQLALCDPL